MCHYEFQYKAKPEWPDRATIYDRLQRLVRTIFSRFPILISSGEV